MSKFEKDLEKLKDQKCLVCGGRGKEDDASPYDAWGYNEWECTKCLGTGYNPNQEQPTDIEAPTNPHQAAGDKAMKLCKNCIHFVSWVNPRATEEDLARYSKCNHSPEPVMGTSYEYCSSKRAKLAILSIVPHDHCGPSGRFYVERSPGNDTLTT